MSKKHPEQEQPAQPETVTPTATEPTNDLVDQLKRLQAEFDNYRKRIDAEAGLAQERGREKIIKDVLPVMDAIELAIKHAGTPDGEKELLTGITLIRSQLHSLFENWGVKEIPAAGIVDPRLHEVYIMETRDDVPANSVTDTMQKGYTRNGTILRTAKVKAARKA